MKNFHRFLKFSPRIYFIAVIISIFLLRIPYLFNGFVWLDHGDIELGRTIVELTSWPVAFFSRFGQTGFYRPLVTLLNSFDFAIYGKEAIGFHFTNVLLHIGVVICTPIFLSRFFRLTWFEQILSMVIVGIAPITWLPVGAISYRSEIMYTLFTMSAVWWYATRICDRARFASQGLYARTVYLTIFAVLSLYAFFSKETALVVLPFFLIVWELGRTYITTDVIDSKKVSKSKEKSKPVSSGTYVSWGAVTTIILIYVMYALLRFIAVPEIWRVQSVELSWPASIGIRITVIGRLLVQVFSPFVPSLSDSIALHQIYGIFALLTVIAIVGSTIYIVRYSFKSIWSRVIILFWVSILPAFNIVPVPRLYSPHYGYFAVMILPMVFVLIVRSVIPTPYRSTGQVPIGISLKPLKGRRSFAWLRMTGFVLICLWIIVASYATFTGGYRFKNDLTLFQPEVIRDDNFLEGHQYIGDYYFFDRGAEGYTNNKLLQKAEKHYIRALKKDNNSVAFVDRTSVLNNLAGVRVQQNRLEEADAILASLEKEQGSGGSLGIRYNRALIAYKQKNYQKVVDLLYSSYKEWRRPEPLILLSESFKKLGDDKKSDEIMKFLGR